MSAVGSEFQRDVFQLRPVILAVGETVHVLDEKGTLLLEVSSPNRVIRLVRTVILAVVLFILIACSLGMIAITVAQHVGPDLSGPLFLCGLLLSFLAGVVGSTWMVVQLLERKHFRFAAAAVKDCTLLELRPRSQNLGFGTIYELWDGQTGLLATLRANLVGNVLFRRCWLGTHPDGDFWFSAREDTAVPRFLRLAMRTGVGLCFLSGALICLVVAIMAFIAAVPAGNQFLIYLSFLVPLIVLHLVAVIAAFLVRKLLPNCLIVGMDCQAVLGRLKRQPSAEGPNILDLSADHDRVLDRRVAVALGVLLAESD